MINLNQNQMISLIKFVPFVEIFRFLDFKTRVNSTFAIELGGFASLIKEPNGIIILNKIVIINDKYHVHHS